MKITKKVLVALLGIAMLFSFSLTVSVFGDAASGYEKNNYEATTGFSKLFESFDLDGLTAIPSYPQTYGGAYINDEGNLVIQYTADDKALYSSKTWLRGITGLQEINVEQVEFSYNELVEANNIIGEYIANELSESFDKKQIPADSLFKGDIVQSAIDAKNNAVVIWLDDVSILNIDIFRKTIVDKPFLKFILSAKERPCFQTTYKSGEGWIGGGSIGFPATYNSYSGIVTAQHCTSSGTNYINGQAYGSRTLSSSTYDYAFIQQTNYTDSITRGIYDTNKTLFSGSYCTLVQGSAVGRTGISTGFSTGTVEYTGVNNLLGNDLFQTNCGSMGGDSGGPYFSSPFSSSTTIAGIHLGGYNDPDLDTTFFRGIGYLFNAGIRI
jgi:streptogrisin B